MNNKNLYPDGKKIAGFIYGLLHSYNSKESIIELIENELHIAYLEGGISKLNEMYEKKLNK